MKDTLEGRASCACRTSWSPAPVCLTTEGSITLEMERIQAYAGHWHGAAEGDARAGAKTASTGVQGAGGRCGDGPGAREEAREHPALRRPLLIAGEELDDPSAYAEDVCSLF